MLNVAAQVLGVSESELSLLASQSMLEKNLFYRVVATIGRVPDLQDEAYIEKEGFDFWLSKM